MLNDESIVHTYMISCFILAVANLVGFMTMIIKFSIDGRKKLNMKGHIAYRFSSACWVAGVAAIVAALVAEYSFAQKKIESIKIIETSF